MQGQGAQGTAKHNKENQTKKKSPVLFSQKSEIVEFG